MNRRSQVKTLLRIAAVALTTCVPTFAAAFPDQPVRFIMPWPPGGGSDIAMRMVAEGVRTTRAAVALGARHGVELPIVAQMAAVLEGRRSPAEAVEALMGRRQRHERER